MSGTGSASSVQPSMASCRTGAADTAGDVVDLVEAAPVEVDVAQMLAPARRGVHEPVPDDLLGERVEAAEQGVGNDCPPDGAVLGGPLRDALRPLDDDPLPLGRLIGDASPVAEPATGGRHPLAVLALVDTNGVPGLRERSSRVDGAQGCTRGAIGGVGSGGGDVVDGHRAGAFPCMRGGSADQGLGTPSPARWPATGMSRRS